MTHVAAGRKSGGKRSSSAAIPQPVDPPRRRIAPRWSAASRDEARPGAKRKDILIDLPMRYSRNGREITSDSSRKKIIDSMAFHELPSGEAPNIDARDFTMSLNRLLKNG